MILCVTPNPAVDRTLVVPHLQLDGVNRAVECRTAAGGKGVNVARAAQTLGETVLCMGFVGGVQGALFEELAHRDGLYARWTRIGGETRACTILLDPEAGHNTVINEQGPPTTEADWLRFRDDTRAAASGAAAACICGSAPPGSPISGYAALVASLHAVGLPVWVDVSGAPLAAVRLLAGVHLKINRDEASALLHQPLERLEDVLAAADALRREGQRSVIITRAAGGAVLASDRGRWHARPPAIKRNNAVGSGDSFLAGLLAALVRGEDEATALAWGTAAGAANAAAAGGAAFSRSQFDTALEGVTVERG
ncbi:MAG TPA: 1-phosphofructokinase family hexose kinase [Candidatus Limnocylindrales bacterium]|nr:1-phosphofructokinase family hexose kinase [Candidatus Limnocylindrales bacterium]